MKKGDKVLCINGTFHVGPDQPFTPEQIRFPEKGETYTIREIVRTRFGLAIRLVEIVNPQFDYDIGGLQEPAWHPNRFRVIQT